MTLAQAIEQGYQPQETPAKLRLGTQLRLYKRMPEGSHPATSQTSITISATADNAEYKLAQQLVKHWGGKGRIGDLEQ